MKELSIEEKAKAYDEALKIARQYWNNRAMPIGTNFQLTRMFPELKESEDERIRKAIVKMISDIDGGSPFEKYGIIKKEALAWLEKQAEQNSAIFIPKFKVGDWITFTRKDGTREVLQVSDIIDDRYHFNHLLQISWSIKECDEKCHLWTINDAKDGDVLATGDEIFIHNGKLDLIGRVCAYCGIYKTYNELRFNCSANNYFTYIKPHPATKEQRDTLMKVMTDAGYTFDFEKKELKKIEQKPQRIVSAEAKEAMYDKLVEWSEEDEKYMNIVVSALLNPSSEGLYCFHKVKSNDVTNWFKSLKYRVQPQSQCKPGDELDEASYQVGIKRVLESPESYGLTEYNWKPSDEQIETLKYACGGNYVDLGILESLYKDLKKLREE